MRNFILSLICLSLLACNNKEREKPPQEKWFESGYKICMQSAVPEAFAKGDSLGKIRGKRIGEFQGYQRAYDEIQDSVMIYTFKNKVFGILKLTWPQFVGFGIGGFSSLLIFSLLYGLFFQRLRNKIIRYVDGELWNPWAKLSQRNKREIRTWETRRDKLQNVDRVFRKYIHKTNVAKQKIHQSIGNDDMQKMVNISNTDQKWDQILAQSESISARAKKYSGVTDLILTKLELGQYEIENNLFDETQDDLHTENFTLGLEIDAFLQQVA